MNLFILAAGKGERLLPLTKNTPKLLIELGDGTTLLERQIKTALCTGIFNEIVIITGYKAEQIDAKIIDYRKDIKLTTVYNPFYDITNNLVSLWTANYKMLENDFMITNGDNIYNGNVYEKMQIECKEIIQISIDVKDKYDEDDMKVKLDEHENLLKVHKEIPLEEVNAESVGLALVKGERSRRVFSNKILQLVKKQEYLNKFWLEIFNSLIVDGATIRTAKIDKDNWKEVDFHPDINDIRRMIKLE